MASRNEPKALVHVFKEFFADTAYWGDGVVDDECYEVDGVQLPSGSRVPQDFADHSMVAIVFGTVYKDKKDRDYGEFFSEWLALRSPRYLTVEIPQGRAEALKALLASGGFEYV